MVAAAPFEKARVAAPRRHAAVDRQPRVHRRRDGLPDVVRRWLLGSGALLTEGALRPVGAHLFTAGFVLSLIYGLGAHMLPRFTGNPIRMGAWPWAQFLALHAGIIVFCAGIALPGVHATLAGGILMWLSLLIYAWRVGPVLWPPPSMPRSAEQ